MASRIIRGPISPFRDVRVSLFLSPKKCRERRLAKRYPDVAILVNNLGIFEPKPFEQISDADWRRLFDANVLERYPNGLNRVRIPESVEL